MVVVDNTALFRAKTKMILAKKKEGEERSTPPLQEESPPKSSPNYGAYAGKCEQIAATISELRNLLLEKRASYVLTMGSDAFGAICVVMTDAERELLEAETTSAIELCKNEINNVLKAVRKDRSLRVDDEAPHLRCSCQLLIAFLQSVAQIIGHMKSLRESKHKKQSKLACLHGLAQIYESSISAGSKNQMKKEESDGWESFSCSEDEVPAPRTTWIKTEPVEKKPLLQKLKKEPKEEKKEYFQMEFERNPYPDLELTETEHVKFALENEQLRQRFQHSDKEVEAVEKQITELQRLQETFAEKVMDQDKDILRVNEVASNTVENIRDGNELIRSAIKNSASRRVIFLFCLIVLTFTLLFLDWYNP